MATGSTIEAAVFVVSESRLAVRKCAPKPAGVALNLEEGVEALFGVCHTRPDQLSKWIERSGDPNRDDIPLTGVPTALLVEYRPADIAALPANEGNGERSVLLVMRLPTQGAPKVAHRAGEERMDQHAAPRRLARRGALQLSCCQETEFSSVLSHWNGHCRRDCPEPGRVLDRSPEVTQARREWITPLGIHSVGRR